MKKINVDSKELKKFFNRRRNLIVTLFVVLLIGITSIIVSFAFFTSSISKNIFSGLVGDVTNPDINIKVLVENLNADGSGTGSYTISYAVPTTGYTYNESKSFCTNGTLTNNADGTYTIESNARTKCEIYYDSDGSLTSSSDIGLTIMKEVKGSNCKGSCGYKVSTDLSVIGLLNQGYIFDAAKSTCSDGGAVSFDYVNNKINVDASGKTDCMAYFSIGPTFTDITSPQSTYSTLTLSASGIDTDYNIATYYYSIDGGATYESSTSSSYTFTGLDDETTYNTAMYVVSDDGRSSNVVFKEFTTGAYSFTQLYSLTSAVQKYTAGATGYYRLQVWGAQGGSYSTTYAGGKGGYSQGDVYLNKGTQLFIYVGGKGTDGKTSGTFAGGYNGGGQAYTGSATYDMSSGGGASDIRIGTDSLYARVIVAGGGGGAGSYSGSYRYAGGAGGGASGSAGGQYTTSYPGGGAGTATSAGISYYGSTQNSTSYGTPAGFGTGGAAASSSYVAGGGGGWYGGGYARRAAGGGGSGYVYTSSSASNYPSGCLLNSTYYLTNTTLSGGADTFTSTSGGTETGHTGDGNAKITYLGKTN